MTMLGLIFIRERQHFFCFYVYIVYFIHMGVKYKLQKLRVKMRKSKEKDLDYLDDVQKLAYGITVDAINDKISNFFYDFSAGRKGIENKDVFIEICKNKIRISNGVSHDDIAIDDRTRESLSVKFNEKMTRRFNTKESQFTNKAVDRLNNIKKEIKDK